MRSLRVSLFLSHIAISTIVIGLSATLIVFVWYPPPFAEIEGLRPILLLMLGVDVCAGPICTLVVSSPKKSRGQLMRDLAIIGVVQLSALSYAFYASFVARPAFIVYNTGRFEIEHANELLPEELAKASSPEFSRAPVSGPVFVEARFPENPDETLRIIQNAIRTGFDIKDMPRYYIPWKSPASDVRSHAKPASVVLSKRPNGEALFDLLRTRGVSTNEALVVPIHGKMQTGAVVLRTSDLEVLGVVP